MHSQRQLASVLAMALVLMAGRVHAAEEASSPKASESPSSEVFAAYADYAEQVRFERYVRALGFAIAGTGAVLTAAGGIPDDDFTRSYLFLAGGLALGTSLANILVVSSPENAVQEFKGQSCCDRAQEAALRARWREEAARARTFRKIVGVTGLVAGVASTALGIAAVAIDDPTFTQPEKGNLAAFGFLTGAFFFAAGTSFLLLPSTSEQTLAHFEASHDFHSSSARELRFGLTPTVGGASLALGGNF